MVDDGSRGAKDARLAGVGLDWDDAPDDLDAVGRAEWERLAAVFAAFPVRFREGDRSALEAYCLTWSMYRAAVAAVLKEGVLIDGRGHGDEERRVKNPVLTVVNQQQQALRLWSRELGLTPDSRGRANLEEKEKPDDDAGNPFA